MIGPIINLIFIDSLANLLYFVINLTSETKISKKSFAKS